MDAAVADTANPLPAPSNEAERMAWVVELRRRFSPSGAVNPDGSMCQEFFRPKTVITIPDRKWGDAERDLLHRGLAQYGVGRWREIGDAFLPGWDDQALRGKASRLLCCQNLSRYVGRRFTAAELEAEAGRNRAIGAQTGCWKNGMLVDNASGTLKQFFAAAQQQREQRQQQQQQEQQEQQQEEQEQQRDKQEQQEHLPPQQQPLPPPMSACGAAGPGSTSDGRAP